MFQGILLYSYNNKVIFLIVICYLVIGIIDYILTICKVINNNKIVMIQLLVKVRYFIDFCDKFFFVYFVI